jgi:hypothetical protein
VGDGNLTVCGHDGKARFSERKGTPLFCCGLPEEMAIDAEHKLVLSVVPGAGDTEKPGGGCG